MISIVPRPALTVNERVRNGSLVLNAYYGHRNWIAWIDLERLDLDLEKLCVLGQLFGDYFQGLCKLNINSLQEAYELGFLRDDPADKEKLEETWIEFLQNN